MGRSAEALSTGIVDRGQWLARIGLEPVVDLVLTDLLLGRVGEFRGRQVGVKRLGDALGEDPAVDHEGQIVGPRGVDLPVLGLEVDDLLDSLGF